MKPPLSNSVILVTGASSGIGRELARKLAPKAKTLILVARREQRLAALRKELTAAHANLTVVVMPCDLTDRAALSKLCDDIIEEHAGVDILVNNAGLGDIGFFEAADWQKTERMLELNMRSLSYLTHRMLSGMIERGRGGILMVSSGFGMAFMPVFGAYAATKHYVTAFSEALRLEVAPLGVVVTQLCPGPVSTEFEEQAGNDTGMAIPTWIQITAEHCAASAVNGFAKGRAIIVPGVVMKCLMFLNGFTPRWLSRLLYGPMSNWYRKRFANKA